MFKNTNYYCISKLFTLGAFIFAGLSTAQAEGFSSTDINKFVPLNDSAFELLSQIEHDADMFEKFYTLGEAQVVHLHSEVLDAHALQSFLGDCSGLAPRTFGVDSYFPFLLSGVDIGQIIAVGKQIWQIVVDNKPVVHTQLPVAHALPRGIECWTDLETWDAPVANSYGVTYTNLLGMNVVDYQFTVLHSPQGSLNGQGQFIANATAIPRSLNVFWGYNMESEVKVGQVLNMGSHQNPMAGMEMSIHWRVRTPIIDNQNTIHFFVKGDGEQKRLN